MAPGCSLIINPTSSQKVATSFRQDGTQFDEQALLNMHLVSEADAYKAMIYRLQPPKSWSSSVDITKWNPYAFEIRRKYCGNLDATQGLRWTEDDSRWLRDWARKHKDDGKCVTEKVMTGIEVAYNAR
jgi:hypothetical protein